MRSKLTSIVPVLGCVVSAIALAACATPLREPSDAAPASATSESPSRDRISGTRISVQGSVRARIPRKVGPAPTDGFKPIEAFKDVRFGPGKIDVLWADRQMLETVVAWLKENPNRLVLLEGYSDDLGTKEQNQAVGERRARSVMNALVSKGVEASRITVASRGSDDPLCTDKTDACRAKNRRVQFLVKERDGR